MDKTRLVKCVSFVLSLCWCWSGENGLTVSHAIDCEDHVWMARFHALMCTKSPHAQSMETKYSKSTH